MRRNDIRNIVIIAHVDHGKTSLVDCMLRQSGQFRESQLQGDCILDSNDLERERGITILAKNIALAYKGVKINIIDTPGHADFGGEVERVVRMADGAILLIDAAEGPMPQTRFVLSKALECGLKPIVVINKIDRPDARPHEVLDEAFGLLMELGADEHLHDFKYLFASGREGYATTDPEVRTDSIQPLLDMVLEVIPGPDVVPDAPLQMLVTTLDWSEFVGRIAIGRIQAGTVNQGQTIALLKSEGRVTESKIQALYVFDKLGRVEVDEVTAGDVCAIVGIEDVEIGDTICHREHHRALERLHVDEPTLEMLFTINSSPFAGREGKYVTNRQLRERLFKELERNVALRVRQIENSDAFAVSGRGILHLSVLIENMRREGYELSVGKPEVILKKIDGQTHEPFESLVVEVPSEKLGSVMELVGQRRGELEEMHVRGEFTHARFTIPARGLIGLRTRLLNATQGTAIIHHRYAGYKPMTGEVPRRANGVYVSMVTGRANAYSLNTLQDRADMFVTHNDEVYEG
jgi:GTP-binding protein